MATIVADMQEMSFRFHQVAKWRGLQARDAHLMARELYEHALQGEPLPPASNVCRSPAQTRNGPETSSVS